MAVLGPLAGVVAGVVGLGAAALSKPKAAPTPASAQPSITPRANSVVADTLSARRGSAANMRTGAGGAESTTVKKTLMGQ